LLTSHLLPEAAFSALAEGAGYPATVWLLRDAQLSKHLMLLHAVADAANTVGDSGGGPAAFRSGYALLAELQATGDGGDWLLGLPHLGSWVHDGLIRIEQGSAADFAHFSCLVAAAAVRSGVPFELDVPVRGGRVLLPGLGFIRVTDESSSVRLCCDGDRVTAGRHFTADRRYLVPDEADTRKVEASARSLLLSMRYLAPARYRELCADGTVALSDADRLLVSGSAEAAVRAYCDEITSCADPRPDAWIGLALALHRLPPSPLRQAFAGDLVLMFEVHACLGDRSNPLDLAGWFA
jgi:HEXXH motif-containing protein